MSGQNFASETGRGAAAQLAQAHWNDTPLFFSEAKRYAIYPWLPEVAGFANHAGDRVLEIGCGTGCDLLQFIKGGAHASGIDLTEEHLRLARERCPGADVRRADGRHIPFPDAHFDHVYSHGVIHHSDEPERIAAEIRRVLKPGGTYNVQVYALWSYHTISLIRKFGIHWKLHVENSTAPVHIDLYTARSLRALFPGCAIAKYHFPRMPRLAPWFGWYLVATGRKPG